MCSLPKAVLCATLLVGIACHGQLMKPAQAALCTACIHGDMSFLASDDASYITGQAVNVDGGLVMS